MPSILPAICQVIIDASPGGECILTSSQTIGHGRKITVKEAKRFRITGELKIE